MDQQAAQTIRELYQQVKPDESLPAGDPRHVDLSPGRGAENPVAQIKRRITVSQPPDRHCCLLTGHRGSGKSTELRRLQADLENEDFLVVYLDVQVTLDLADVEYLDVLLAIAQNLEDSARQHKLKLSDNLLQDVQDWFFNEEIITEEEVHDYERTLGANYELGAEVPLFAKMMASLTGKIRTGSAKRRLVREKIEPQLEELIHLLKSLVDNVQIKAQENGFAGLVIIVDSLEKMMLRQVNDQTNHALLFVEHAEQLRSIPCHTVYTVPVSLLNDRNLVNFYEGVDLIPMVKVADAEREPSKIGRDLMYEAVTRRVNTTKLFEQPDLVYKLIDASGGVMRDLMHLLLFAADFTPRDGTITSQAVEKAIHKLVRLYDRLIHEEDLDLLLQISRNVHTGMSARLAKLMYNRLVLPYINDDNWRDLHPAVRETTTFRAYLHRQQPHEA